MLDLKKLKKDPKSVADNLKKRGFKLDLDKWDKLEASRKSLQSDTENMQAELNEISKEIGIHKKDGTDSSSLEKKASEITLKIKSQSKDLTSILEDLDNFVSSIPNIIDDDVPSTVVVEYADCGMVITGNYILIAQEQNKDDKTINNKINSPRASKSYESLIENNVRKT